MDFLRRLIGRQPAQPSKPGAPTESSTTGAGAPEISFPKDPMETTPALPMPILVASPSKNSQAKTATGAAGADASPAPYGATRPLPPLEPYVSKPNKHLTFGLNSDIGMMRSNNQDALYAFFTSFISSRSLPELGLFIVADGMGGHQEGEKASAIAAQVIAREVMTEFYMKLLDTDLDDADKPIISEVLTAAFQKANESVAAQVPEGGTTATAAAIVGDLSYIAHVGDSRAYLITAEGMEQITRDHSLVQRLKELDQLNDEEASVHPQRNVLYRAIGQSAEVEVDAATRRLPPGSRLLLCSDGLWNQVPESSLLQTVVSSATPQEACDRLVVAANERGGPDNITAILVQVPG
jgi:protein phosphatase